MKQKYDREGVEFIEDEMELAEQQPGGDGTRQRRQAEKAETIHGSRKPGSSSSFEMMPSQRNINMGADNDNQKNPLSMLINTAKKTIGRD